MTGTWGRRMAQERITAVEDLDAGKYRQQVLALLRDVVPYDAHIWLLTDPVTAVGAAPYADVPCLAELPTLIKAKYLTTVNRWTDQEVTSSRLDHATAGDLSQSRAWRDVLSRYGVRDVLSTVFQDAYGLWGFLELWRIAPSEPFTAADAELLTDLAPTLTTAIRLVQAATFQSDAATQRPDLGPVVLTLDDDLRIVSRTADSQVWLDTLLPPASSGGAVPASVYNVAAALLAREQGVDDRPPYSRTHLDDGFWLTLRAARMPGEPGRSEPIVVTMQESSASDRLELFARAVGLTTRERDLLGLLATGGNTRSMAKEMGVSDHTVQDHFKSVFAKTGTRDRVALLARALGAQAPVSRPTTSR